MNNYISGPAQTYRMAVLLERPNSRLRVRFDGLEETGSGNPNFSSVSKATSCYLSTPALKMASSTFQRQQSARCVTSPTARVLRCVYLNTPVSCNHAVVTIISSVFAIVSNFLSACDTN